MSGRSCSPSARGISSCLLIALVATLNFFTTGCGTYYLTPKSTTGNTGSTGETGVTVLASSTANGQLFQFTVTLQDLTLVSQSGTTVPLLSSPVSDEFMHLNGSVEPLTTVSIPADVYTSAVATFGSAYPACAGQSEGSVFMNEALNGPGPSRVTVNLPSPIKVTGTGMGLILNLQVSSSAPFTGLCNSSLTNTVSVAPVFSLTPVTMAAQPTNFTNGKAVGLVGLIASTDAGKGFSVNGLFSMNEGAAPPSWQVSFNDHTVFQGINGASQLVAGMPLDMDVAVGSDGSLLATRVEVLDPNPVGVSAFMGPTMSLPLNQPQQSGSLVVEQRGPVARRALVDMYDFGSAAFQVSAQLSNLQHLPFAAVFNASNMIDGQNVLATTHAQLVNKLAPVPLPVTTMTLLPQTINGTVTASSSQSGFTTYTVTLPAYDIFTDLAVQPGQDTRLSNPGSLIVYADSNTQKLNTKPLATGSTFRFTGLVFNDNGTLRMDCMQITDGVSG